MEIAHQLGKLFLGALPTTIGVLLFFFFLRWAFFKPIQEAMAKREALIEGARTEAASVEAAAKQELDTYNDALRKARAEILYNLYFRSYFAVRQISFPLASSERHPKSPAGPPGPAHRLSPVPGVLCETNVLRVPKTSGLYRSSEVASGSLPGLTCHGRRWQAPDSAWWFRATCDPSSAAPCAHRNPGGASGSRT